MRRLGILLSVLLLAIVSLSINAGNVMASSLEDLLRSFEQTNNYSEITSTLKKPLYNFYGADLEPRTNGFGLGCFNEQGWLLPVTEESSAIGSHYGQRDHPILKNDDGTPVRRLHGGIDLGGVLNSPIFASRGGIVTSSGGEWNGGYGKMILIDHGDGYVTRYAHLNGVNVQDGQAVTAGETIGLLGSTGLSTGPHLHFEIIQNGTQIDPAPLLFGEGSDGEDHECSSEEYSGLGCQGAPDSLVQEALRAGISDTRELAHFLAQVAHETGGFNLSVEQGSEEYFERYEGRSDLGNNQPGDGARYKGRGYIQLTGRSNYRYYGNLIGEDLENNPGLAASPSVAAKVSVAYWLDRVRPNGGALDLVQGTKLINGGFNGLEDRQARFAECQAELVGNNSLESEEA